MEQNKKQNDREDDDMNENGKLNSFLVMAGLAIAGLITVGYIAAGLMIFFHLR